MPMQIFEYIYVATTFNYYNIPYNMQLINMKIIFPIQQVLADYFELIQ